MFRRKRKTKKEKTRPSVDYTKVSRELKRYLKMARNAGRHDLLVHTLPLSYIPPHLWTPEDIQNFRRLEQFAKKYGKVKATRARLERATTSAGRLRARLTEVDKYGEIYSVFDGGKIHITKAINLDLSKYKEIPSNLKNKLETIRKFRELFARAERLPQRHASVASIIKMKKIDPRTIDALSRRIEILERLHNIDLSKELGVKGVPVEGTLLEHLYSRIKSKYGVDSLLDLQRLPNKKIKQELGNIRKLIAKLRSLKEEGLLDATVRVYARTHPGRSILEITPRELDSIVKGIKDVMKLRKAAGVGAKLKEKLKSKDISQILDEIMSENMIVLPRLLETELPPEDRVPKEFRGEIQQLNTLKALLKDRLREFPYEYTKHDILPNILFQISPDEYKILKNRVIQFQRLKRIKLADRLGVDEKLLPGTMLDVLAARLERKYKDNFVSIFDIRKHKDEEISRELGNIGRIITELEKLDPETRKLAIEEYNRVHKRSILEMDPKNLPAFLDYIKSGEYEEFRRISEGAKHPDIEQAKKEVREELMQEFAEIDEIAETKKKEGEDKSVEELFREIGKEIDKKLGKTPEEESLFEELEELEGIVSRGGEKKPGKKKKSKK